jgi:NAD(P)-dependent dehydrogenase (short-subunit alcohol dehydrogenase family)
MKNTSVVIVTGASSGIGKATAELFAREGAKVVLSDLAEEAGAAVAAGIRARGGEALFVKADVADPAQMEKLVGETLTAFGRLDIAVNNAGIAGDQGLIADLSVETWERVIRVNLSGVFFGMKYQIPAMLKNGGGSIVNISSILGAVAFAGASAYTAAKHGLLGLTQTAALEYSPQNIRVNAVGPAFIDTPMLKALDDETKKAVVALHPIGRLGRSEEVAELIFWLGSEKSSFVTGSYYPIDGGYLSR